MNSAQIRNKATRISLFSLQTVQMRAFHMSWFAFFLAFFGWFGIAPLMVIVRDDLASRRRRSATPSSRPSRSRSSPASSSAG